MLQENRIPCIHGGQVRRDCEPHRGSFLKLLGAVSMLLGALSVCTVLPRLVGFPLGLWLWRTVRADQEKMDVGIMDPDGKQAAEVARIWAINGMQFCVIAWCIWALHPLFGGVRQEIGP
jgi:hypothetical protein